MLFSIIIPIYNGERVITRLLEKLDRLTRGFTREIIVIDSESKDGTLEKVEKVQKYVAGIKIVNILKKKFNHGTTRNLGAKLAKGKFITFVSHDALPRNPKTFSYFLKDFEIGEKVVAVFTKEVPYKNSPFFQRAEAYCRYQTFDRHSDSNGLIIQNTTIPFVPLTKENKLLWWGLSNVFSCYRRSFLLKNPFQKVDYGEDLIMGKKIIDLGYTKVYDAKCAVTHSHHYNLLEYYMRQKKDLYLRVNKLKLGSSLGLLCKIKHIFRSKYSIGQKALYFCELIPYYLVKALIFVEVKLAVIE